MKMLLLTVSYFSFSLGRQNNTNIVFPFKNNQIQCRKNPDKGQSLQVGDVSLLEQSNFNSSLATKIFVHGYGALPSQGYSSKDGEPEKSS